MSTDEKHVREEMSREVRLGIVMYGGVSLAIYINGVCQEFFRAVRGRGAYKWIKALTDSEVIVDIVSGTSAGGINGIMLAYSLCNEKDFSYSSNLWRIDGDIRSLLRSPGDGAQTTESILNSEGYYQPRLEAAFREMPDYVPEKGELTSDFNELDLFVTGTDVDGNISTQFDDAGHPIDVKDHRSVFVLKHRRGRSHPFDPTFLPEAAPRARVKEETTYRALAKLARITSCFPGAFAPVFVSEDETEEDRKLQFWGQIGKEAVFLDGGVIDNKPFTHTLQDIFYREADCVVDRKLIYVEPDPESWKKLEKAIRPNFFQSIFKSLIGIPGYESISEDLKMLADHNTKLDHYRRLTKSLCQPGGELPPSKDEKIKELYEKSIGIKFSDRIVRGILKINGKEKLLEPEKRRVASRLVSVFEQASTRESSLDASAYGVSEATPCILAAYRFDVYYRLRRLFHMTYALPLLIDQPDCTPEKKERYRQLWRAFNHQIKLLRVVKDRIEGLIDEADIRWEEKFKEDEGEAAHVNAALGIWETVILAMQSLLHVDEELDRLLHEDFEKCRARRWEAGRIAADSIAPINRKLKKRAREIIEQMQGGQPPASPPARKFINLLTRLRYQEAACFLAAGIADDDKARKAYDQFRNLDAYIFPTEMISELYEKDIIETIRISPRDAERGFSNKGYSDKVSGDALHHFGGFFKRSWRSNDILWGRIDGTCQLIECLLTEKRLKELYASAAGSPREAADSNCVKLREKVRQRFFRNTPASAEDIQWVAGMSPEEVFPRAGKYTQDRLAEWLYKLLCSDERGVREAACEIEGHAGNASREFEPLETIIAAAQLEIIAADLPTVIMDALSEQSRWNQFLFPRKRRWLRRSTGAGNGAQPAPALTATTVAPADSQALQPGLDFNPLAYKSAGGNLDPLAAITAAFDQTQDVMKIFDDTSSHKGPLTETRLGRYFRNDYKVGAETLRTDVPQLILLEIFSVSLLVLRNCILGALGENAEKVKNNPLYKFILDYPLRVFHAAVTFWRRAPNWGRILLGIPVLLSAFMLFLGILFSKGLIYTSEGLNLMAFIFFIGVPCLIFYAAYLFTAHRRIRGFALYRWLRKLFIVALTVAPVIMFFLTVHAVVAQGVGRLTPETFGALFERGVNALALRLNYVLTLPGTRVSGVILFFAYIAGFFGPYLANILLSERRAQASRKDLEKVLKAHFQVDVMVLLVNRLAANLRFRLSDVQPILDEHLKGLANRARLEELKRELAEAAILEWGAVRDSVRDKDWLKLLAKEFGRAEAMKYEDLRKALGGYTGQFEALESLRLIEWSRVQRVFNRTFHDNTLARSLANAIMRRLEPFVIDHTIVVGHLQQQLLGYFGKDRAQRVIQDAVFKQSGYGPEAREQALMDLISHPAIYETLQDYLEANYVMARIAAEPKLNIPLLVEGELPNIDHREELAEKITAWAADNNLLPQLEYQMRLLNPEALYHL